MAKESTGIMFSVKYRVMVYGRFDGIPGVNLTRDQIARQCGHITNNALRNVAHFCNVRGISDIREVFDYKPTEVTSVDGIGDRTMFAIARLGMGTLPDVVRQHPEWRPQNDRPIESEDEVREQEAKIARSKSTRSLVPYKLPKPPARRPTAGTVRRGKTTAKGRR